MDLSIISGFFFLMVVSFTAPQTEDLRVMHYVLMLFLLLIPCGGRSFQYFYKKNQMQ